MSEQSWPTANTPRTAPETFRPLRGHAIGAMIGIVLSLVVNVVALVALWQTVNALNAFVEGTGTRSELLSAAEFSDGLLWPALLAIIVAGVPFLVWSWRARANAEFFAGVASQRRGRGWVIFGWFVPIVNFWFPYQVIADIWRASRPAPATSPQALLGWWWAAFLGSWVLDRLTRNYLEPDVGSLNTLLVITAIGTALYFVAGILIFMIINQITAWQTERGTGTAR